ncbi:amidase family protein [Streptomyces sp. Je 1-369]|uniref:amidase family protein n=1 Tax=Streptomyces sp. Je 1-369 TaxID=2966192 RepID=UPI002285DD44|nr:amidase family protein [Streptomyces sp. Je 1-369]WAL99830.1 amidase family protein [Streptomyces sp. Je 1-369]
MTHLPIDPFTSAVELAAAIRRKEVSPVEVADSYLQRMDALDPRLNAYCHRADHDVRKAAAQATDAVVRAASPQDLPAFHGVPLPVKDYLDVAGWPTTYGSAGADPAPVTPPRGGHPRPHSAPSRTRSRQLRPRGSESECSWNHRSPG